MDSTRITPDVAELIQAEFLPTPEEVGAIEISLYMRHHCTLLTSLARGTERPQQPGSEACSYRPIHFRCLEFMKENIIWLIIFLTAALGPASSGATGPHLPHGYI